MANYTPAVTALALRSPVLHRSTSSPLTMGCPCEAVRTCIRPRQSQSRVHADTASIERRITRCISTFDRNKSWLMVPQPAWEASITRTPSCSMAAFSAAPTRVIPPAIRPDSANARSFVERHECAPACRASRGRIMLAKLHERKFRFTAGETDSERLKLSLWKAFSGDDAGNPSLLRTSAGFSVTCRPQCEKAAPAWRPPFQNADKSLPTDLPTNGLGSAWFRGAGCADATIYVSTHQQSDG